MSYSSREPGFGGREAQKGSKSPPGGKQDELLAATYGHLWPFPSVCSLAPTPGFQDYGVTSAARQLLPPAKFSIIQQTYADSNRWIFLIPPGPGTRPTQRRKENIFHISSHSNAYYQPLHLLPNPPPLTGRVPATATTLDATVATVAIATATAASPTLNLGSCLLFPARASGCLLLGSAHPLGSTVRLRGPAQGRQTGLRTSVLPWRTGSRKRRYGTILCHSPTHCCRQPWIS